LGNQFFDGYETSHEYPEQSGHTGNDYWRLPYALTKIIII